MIDPLVLLAGDRSRARAAGDPWASLCVLATQSQMRPEVRTLVLRDIEDRLAIFINATSPKHHQIALHPEVTVLIYLASCGVQYRLQAALEPIPSRIVHAAWRARPRIPKVMDWLYRDHAPQSARVESRQSMEAAFGIADARLGGDAAAPEEAIGHYLVASEIERLELATDRLHDRQRFRRHDGGWVSEVLMP